MFSTLSHRNIGDRIRTALPGDCIARHNSRDAASRGHGMAALGIHAVFRAGRVRGAEGRVAGQYGEVAAGHAVRAVVPGAGAHTLLRFPDGYVASIQGRSGEAGAVQPLDGETHQRLGRNCRRELTPCADSPYAWPLRLYGTVHTMGEYRAGPPYSHTEGVLAKRASTLLRGA